MFEPRYIIIIFVILLGILIQIIRGRITMLQAYAFLVPFFGIDLDIGLRVTASQVFLLIINILLLLKAFIKPGSISFKGLNKYIFIFLLYAFLSDIILSMYDIKFIHTSNPGYLRNEGRFISQILVFSLYFSIFFVITNFIRKFSDLRNLVKYFLLGVFVLAVLGVFQELLFVLARIDFLPLGSYGHPRTASEFSYFGVTMIRICSLAGEPKSFGMFLAIAIVILRMSNKLNRPFFRNQRVYIFGLLGLLVLTLSTSGFLMLVILIVISEVFMRFYIKGSLNRTTVLSSIILISFIAYFSKPLEDIMQERIFGRDLTNEDFDVTINNFLKDNPEWLVFGSGLGNIHNLAAPYMPVESEFYMQDTIFIAKSGYLRILSETGAVGSFLFIIANLVIIFKCLRFYRKTKLKELLFYGILSILLFIAYLARGNYVIEIYLLILAIANVSKLLLTDKDLELETTGT